MMPARFKPWIAYLIALIGVIGAILLRHQLDTVLGDHLSFGFFFLAVSVAAWTGGFKPAMFAAVLSSLLANYLFTEPARSLRIASAEEFLNLAVFLSVSVVIGILSEISLRSLARAQLAEKQKDNFLATLAHELRNPLTVIQYAVELDRAGGFKNGDERSDVIDRQVKHLSRLIEDLLDVSRAACGKITLMPERLDAAELVTCALEKVQPLIDCRKHILQVHVSPVSLPLEGDRIRLEQVLVNLLSNAAKYTPDEGEIELSVYPEYDQIVFAVRDNGIGIPKHMLHQVFELFTQVETSAPRSDGGLGIGLSLVRNLVKLHGGTVSAASDGLGRGCQFTVRLPMNKEPAGPTVATRDIAPEAKALEKRHS